MQPDAGVRPGVACRRLAFEQDLLVDDILFQALPVPLDEVALGLGPLGLGFQSGRGGEDDFIKTPAVIGEILTADPVLGGSGAQTYCRPCA